MQLTDTHAHIYLSEFDDDRDDMLDRAFASGIGCILTPNVDNDTIDPMLALCRRYPRQCFPMLGLHPTSVKENGWNELQTIIARKDDYKFCAIGEIGLDLYWDKTFLAQQIAIFEEQLRLSVEWDLPVVIHSREAHRYVIESVQRIGAKRLRGIFHSFGSTTEELYDIINLENFMVGINGVATFKNSSLSETLKNTPVEKLVLETDAPYLSPSPYRGKRNEPVYIWKTAEKVADILKMPLSQLVAITEKNVKTLFNLQ